MGKLIILCIALLFGALTTSLISPSAQAIILSLETSPGVGRIIAILPSGERLRLDANAADRTLEWSFLNQNNAWAERSVSQGLARGPVSPSWRSDSGFPLTESPLYATGFTDTVLAVGLERSILIFGPEKQIVLFPLPEGKTIHDLYEFTLDSSIPNRPLFHWKSEGGVASAFALNVSPLSIAPGDLRALRINHNGTSPAVVDGPQSLRRDLAEYGFRDGVVVRMDRVSDRPGLYIDHLDGREPTLVSSDPVIQYPVTGTANRPFELAFESEPVALPVVTERQVLIVRPNGQVEELPFDMRQIRLNAVKDAALEDRAVQMRTHHFTHEGKRYMLVSLDYALDPSVDSAIAQLNNGETFLVPEDGEAFRIAYQATSTASDVVSVTNSILTIKGLIRKIDLQRLAGEQFFTPRITAPARDNYGSIVADPVAATEAVFPNLMRTLGPGGRTPHALSQEDLPTLNHVRSALGAQEAGSVAVLGPAGSGKTQILEAFFSAAAHGSVPEVPRTMRVLRVDRSSLTAGNQYVGNFESRVGTLRAAAGYVPIIILADEMHSLRGAGTGKASNVDFFDMVKTDLADGTMRIAGTDTAAEFYAAFGGDSAILRRVQTVNRPVMGRARTLAAMDSWIARYRLPAISPEVRDFAYLASERFVAIGAQPSKATALLDRAYSRHRTVNGSTAPLTREAIIETLVSMGVDPLLFDEGGADASIARIDNGWNELVIGQTATRGALRTQEFARLNDLRDTRRIAISVLVVGTFGTGKTLSGTAFAQLTGRPSRVLNMADYPDSQLEAFKRLMVQQQRENAFTLYIADEIHLAGRQVQAFLQAILENGVLELPDYVGPAGTTPTATTFVDFRNAGIYATTNAGMEAVARHYAAPAERPIQIGFGLGGSAVPEAQARLTSAMAAQRDEVVRNQALRGAIAEGGIIPALVNRFVHVVPSQTATREQFREIVGLELRKYLRQIEASRGLRITFENEAAFLDAATDVYFDPTAGNRVIRLAIERHVSNALNEGLARIPAIEGSPVRSVTARFNLETGLAELGPDCEGLMLGAR